MDEVATHNKPGDLWVVIKGMVYDLSTFYLQHPGGKNIVLQSAGKDVSQIFDPFHPGDIIQRTLDPALCLGPVDQTTVKPKHVAGHNDEQGFARGVDSHQKSVRRGPREIQKERQIRKKPKLRHLDFGRSYKDSATFTVEEARVWKKTKKVARKNNKTYEHTKNHADNTDKPIQTRFCIEKGEKRALRGVPTK